MNAGITVDDIHCTEAIYGKAVPIIKGKMVRKRPKHVSNVPRFRIPVPLLKHHPTDELDIDFLYTQGAPYVLLSKTHKVKFQSVQCFNKISTQKKKTQYTTYKWGPKEIIAGIKKVIQLYNTRGLDITTVHGDNEFHKIESKIGTHVNICAALQHIRHIERAITITLKERVRCCWVATLYSSTKVNDRWKCNRHDSMSKRSTTWRRNIPHP